MEHINKKKNIRNTQIFSNFFDDKNQDYNNKNKNNIKASTVTIKITNRDPRKSNTITFSSFNDLNNIDPVIWKVFLKFKQFIEYEKSKKDTDRV